MLDYSGMKNLRSVTSQTIQVSPITVFYGPNGAGKSTLMHSLLFLKNIVLNPNQAVDNFFSVGPISFGGFEQVVFDHDKEKSIVLEIGCSSADGVHTKYSVEVGQGSGRFKLDVGPPWSFDMEVKVSFPYPGGKQESRVVQLDGEEYTVRWNGITAQVASTSADAQSAERATQLAEAINRPVEELRRLDFVPVKRGFSKPFYTPSSPTPGVLTEDQVAAILSDVYVEGDVSTYVERVAGMEVRVRPPVGTAVFYIYLKDRQTGLMTEIVNEGFGVNQIVYLLTETLRKDVSQICIEEPEVHLHPTAQRNLAHTLARIAKDRNKAIIISTHSEQFVLSLLSAVAKGIISPTDLSCYLCTKKGKETRR